MTERPRSPGYEPGLSHQPPTEYVRYQPTEAAKPRQPPAGRHAARAAGQHGGADLPVPPDHEAQGGDRGQRGRRGRGGGHGAGRRPTGSAHRRSLGGGGAADLTSAVPAVGVAQALPVTIAVGVRIALGVPLAVPSRCIRPRRCRLRPPRRRQRSPRPRRLPRRRPGLPSASLARAHRHSRINSMMRKTLWKIRAWWSIRGTPYR